MAKEAAASEKPLFWPNTNDALCQSLAQLDANSVPLCPSQVTALSYDAKLPMLLGGDEAGHVAVSVADSQGWTNVVGDPLRAKNAYRTGRDVVGVAGDGQHLAAVHSGRFLSFGTLNGVRELTSADLPYRPTSLLFLPSQGLLIVGSEEALCFYDHRSGLYRNVITPGCETLGLLSDATSEHRFLAYGRTVSKEHSNSFLHFLDMRTIESRALERFVGSYGGIGSAVLDSKADRFAWASESGRLYSASLHTLQREFDEVLNGGKDYGYPVQLLASVRAEALLTHSPLLTKPKMASIVSDKAAVWLYPAPEFGKRAAIFNRLRDLRPISLHGNHSSIYSLFSAHSSIPTLAGSHSKGHVTVWR